MPTSEICVVLVTGDWSTLDRNDLALEVRDLLVVLRPKQLWTVHVHAREK